MVSLEDFLEEEEYVLGHGYVRIKKSKRIPGEWYSVDGKGWSAYNPEHEKILAEWDRERELKYLYACFMYYHYKPEGSDDNLSTPLPDEEFDQLQVALNHTRERWSSYFKSKVGETDKQTFKANAFAIALNDQEQKAAIEWAKNEITKRSGT